MTNDDFQKLAELYGFAPSRALRELLEAVDRQAFHDANIAASRTILDAAVLEEREACAKILDRNAEACANNSMLRDVLMGNAAAIRARGNT